MSHVNLTKKKWMSLALGTMSAIRKQFKNDKYKKNELRYEIHNTLIVGVLFIQILLFFKFFFKVNMCEKWSCTTWYMTL